jgi:hypothetical protein
MPNISTNFTSTYLFWRRHIVIRLAAAILWTLGRPLLLNFKPEVSLEHAGVGGNEVAL